MNREAIEQTLFSGYMTYWSRSRSSLWLKGESSGNRQRLISMRVDCDGDTLLCEVEPLGPACHTRRDTCFYLQVNNHDDNVAVECSPPTPGIHRSST